MNTIRRKIKKEYPCHANESMTQYDELSFEAEKGKFYIDLEHYNPFEGYKRIGISLDKDGARLLLKALELYLK